MNLFHVILLTLGILQGSVAPLSAQAYPWLAAPDSGHFLAARIAPPPGYQRVVSAPGSFAHWLQHLPLKEGKPDVFLYNGIEKRNQSAHAAVVDIDVGKRDLQQCADAVIRLRAEYLFSTGNFQDMHFNFTSGDRIDFSYWAKGYRPIVRDNRVVWMKSGEKNASHRSLTNYLRTIFTYAGTASLNSEMMAVGSLDSMRIGDVFIRGGFPGHAVLIVDMAEHGERGDKLFLIVQSYMPAQNIHILVNPADARLSPWYSVDFGDVLVTPEWNFDAGELRRFP